jgi:hypothetical protein
MRIIISSTYTQLTCIQRVKRIIGKFTYTIMNSMMKETTVSRRRCPSCAKPTILSDENSGELFFHRMKQIEQGQVLVPHLQCTIWDYLL